MKFIHTLEKSGCRVGDVPFVFILLTLADARG
jgi:hypothetical protein